MLEINKIHLGDCLELMKEIEDKSIDLLLTDPPYKQEFHGRGMSKDRPNYKKISNYGSNANIDYSEFFEILIILHLKK